MSGGQPVCCCTSTDVYCRTAMHCGVFPCSWPTHCSRLWHAIKKFVLDCPSDCRCRCLQAPPAGSRWGASH